MKIHPGLAKPLDAPLHKHRVAIALVRDNGQGHDVHGGRRRGNEHRVQGVLAGLAVNIAKSLNDACASFVNRPPQNKKK